jgi:hypothetical protein
MAPKAYLCRPGIWLENIPSTLSYEGEIPEYKYFEPKRTSLEEYEEMKAIFSNKKWNFINLSISKPNFLLIL